MYCKLLLLYATEVFLSSAENVTENWFEMMMKLSPTIPEPTESWFERLMRKSGLDHTQNYYDHYLQMAPNSTPSLGQRFIMKYRNCSLFEPVVPFLPPLPKIHLTPNDMFYFTLPGNYKNLT